MSFGSLHKSIRLGLLLSFVAACGSKSTTTGTTSGAGSTDQPQVIRSVPLNGSLGVADDTQIEIEFDQPVTLGDDWMQISCDSASASASALPISGGPALYKVAALALPKGEVCFLNIFAKQVASTATGSNPAADVSIAFEVKGTAPSAVDDTFSADRRRGFASADGALLANDSLGDFPAVVISFGGGDLGGTVEDNGAGVAVALGDDGYAGVTSSGYLEVKPPSTATADIHFSYQIYNYEGLSTAEVTIHVFESSLPKRDDGYFAIPGQTLSVNAANGVLANDELGLPTSTFRGFANGDLGTETEYEADDTATVANVGTVTMHADGSFEVAPVATFHGTIRWLYALQNAAGVFAAEVVVVVPQAPTATADHYTDIVMNTPLAIGASGPTGVATLALTGSVLDNDIAGVGTATLTVESGTFATAHSGSVDLLANGSFVYFPPLDYAGDDTFTYVVSDGFLTAQGTVTLTINSARVYYVGVGGSGDGRAWSPLGTIASAIAVTPPDTLTSHRSIVLTGAGTYPEDVVLPDGQSLIGRGVNITITAGSTVRTLLATPGVPSTVQKLQVAANTHVRGVAISYAGAGTAVTSTATPTGIELDLEGITCVSCAKALELEQNGGGTVRVRAMAVTASDHAVLFLNFAGRAEFGPTAATGPVLVADSTNDSLIFSNVDEVVINRVQSSGISPVALHEVDRATVTNSVLNGALDGIEWTRNSAGTVSFTASGNTATGTSAGISLTSGPVATSTATFVVTNNTNSSGGLALVVITSGGWTQSLDVHGNAFTNAGTDITLTGEGDAVVKLAGYTGAANDQSAISTYLGTVNTGSVTTTVTATETASIEAP